LGRRTDDRRPQKEGPDARTPGPSKCSAEGSLEGDILEVALVDVHVLALAAAPAGRTAAELAGDLFGDPARTVTVRAEVSRLRRTLGPLLLHQPYRLGVPVEVRLPADPARLLPGSDAPVALRARAGGARPGL
jgi:hypothetical protein